MKNYNIKTLRPLGFNNTGINFMIFTLILVETCLKYDAIHDFSLLLRMVQIQRILTDFEAMLGKNWYSKKKIFGHYFYAFVVRISLFFPIKINFYNNRLCF